MFGVFACNDCNFIFKNLIINNFIFNNNTIHGIIRGYNVIFDNVILNNNPIYGIFKSDINSPHIY